MVQGLGLCDRVERLGLGGHGQLQLQEPFAWVTAHDGVNVGVFEAACGGQAAVAVDDLERVAGVDDEERLLHAEGLDGQGQLGDVADLAAGVAAGP